MRREDIQYWAGLIASVAAGIMAVTVVPPPYDKVLLILASVGSSVSSYHITPPRLK